LKGEVSRRTLRLYHAISLYKIHYGWDIVVIAGDLLGAGWRTRCKKGQNEAVSAPRMRSCTKKAPNNMSFHWITAHSATR
jgi:hypothetical protein